MEHPLKSSNGDFAYQLSRVQLALASRALRTARSRRGLKSASTSTKCDDAVSASLPSDRLMTAHQGVGDANQKEVEQHQDVDMISDENMIPESDANNDCQMDTAEEIIDVTSEEPELLTCGSNTVTDGDVSPCASQPKQSVSLIESVVEPKRSQEFTDRLASMRQAFARLRDCLCTTKATTRTLQEHAEVERFLSLLLPDYHALLQEAECRDTGNLSENKTDLSDMLIDLFKTTLACWLTAGSKTKGIDVFNRCWHQTLSILRRIVDLLADVYVLLSLNYTLYAMAERYCVYVEQKRIAREKFSFAFEQLNLLTNQITNRLRQC